MIEIKAKYNLEKIFLVIVFAVLLWVGHANLMDHKIAHDFPFGYMASDAFQHQTRAEGLKDLGNYRYEAFYNMAGYKDVVGFYMPLLYHVGVIFSNVSGLEAYDGVFFLLFLLSCFAALIMYFIIKKFNKIVAILSLPLSILIFSKGTYIGFTWGHWPSITAQFFLLAMFWSIAYLSERNIYFLIALFLSATILTHTSEGIFGVIFLGFYITAVVLTKQFDFKKFKKIISIGIMTLLTTTYFLFIFKFAWYDTQASGYKFKLEPIWGGTPGFYMPFFGILLVFIIIGLIFSLVLLLKKKKYITLYLGLFMLMAGYSNYIGWGSRAFALRFFWPIYLSVFFGLGIYFILKFFVKKWKLIYVFFIGLVLLFLFTGIVNIKGIPNYQKVVGSMMDGYHWEALSWFEDNTPQDSSIYFFYGDIYDQDALLRNSKRLHHLIVPQDYIDALNNKSIKRYYDSETPGDGGGKMIYRKGIFSYGLRLGENESYKGGNIDICTVDYYVFDKVSRYPQLAQYNMVIRDVLLKTGWMEEAFSNNMVSILKNNKPGEDCLPFGGIKIG